MPDDIKKPTPTQPTQGDLSFEEALNKLETIVETMESSDLPLETLLQRFEEGSRLLQLCRTRLEQAELKIQKLEKNAAGETTLKPLDKLSALAKE